MNSRWMPIQRLFAVATVSALLALPKIALADDGVVLDVQSGGPIPNAIVVTTWEGLALLPAQGGTVCEKAELAISDAQGRFSVSWAGLNPGLHLRHRTVSVLARGYRMSPERDPDSLRVPMEPDKRTPSERLAAMRGTPLGGAALTTNSSCPTTARSLKGLPRWREQPRKGSWSMKCSFGSS